MGISRFSAAAVTWLALLAGVIVPAVGVIAAEVVDFPRLTIDLGTVVSDINTSVAFYTDGIGFRAVKGFDVGADVAQAAGLTDGKPVSIRVLVLGVGPDATKLKLMQVAGTSPRGGDNQFIHSHTGVRYLTIMVADIDAAVSRLKAIGVEPLAQSPVQLPESLGPGLSLLCVRDPDGNIVELVGPKSQKK